MPERRVADYSDAVLLTPGEDSMFDGTLLQMIENLIADKTIIAGDLPGFFKIRHIEVADPPGEDLALKVKLLEGLEGVLQRVLRRASATGNSQATRC